MGENISYPLPMAVFGILQLACGLAYLILSRELISLVIYLVGVPLAFLDSRIAFDCYFLVAALWIIPDRRIRQRIKNSGPI